MVDGIIVCDPCQLAAAAVLIVFSLALYHNRLDHNY